MFTVIKRELGAFFHSYRGYSFIAAFVLIFSIFQMIYQGHDIDEVNLLVAETGYSFYILEQWLEFLPVAFVLANPLLTFDIFNDERRNGADSLLRSLPIRSKDVFFGKLLACEIVFVATYAVVVAVMLFFGFYKEIGFAKVAVSILSYLFVCNAILAIQMLVAAVCKRKLVSFAVSYGVSAVLITLFAVGKGMTGVAKTLLSSLSVIGTYAPSLYGIFDITALVLQVSVFILFTFLAYSFVKREIEK